MNRTLHVVMPMAGRGSRFANAGVKTPKPLIMVDDQPMFLKALSSLDDIHAEKRYTIIIREEHEKAYHMSDLLKQALPAVNIVVSHDEPTGAVVDALRAREFVDDNEGLIIMDCDLWFRSASYTAMVQTSLSDESSIDAGLLTFKATDARYSYALIGPDGMVTRTAEKEVISDSAITGAYFFAKASVFNSAAEILLAKPLGDTMKEYYISYIYNVLLQRGAKVTAATVDQFASFGTPEELHAYETHTQNNALT